MKTAVGILTIAAMAVLAALVTIAREVPTDEDGPEPAVERSSSSPPPSPLQGNVPVQTQGEARSQPADQDAPDASTVAAAPAARLQQSPAQAELENEQLGQVQDQLVQLRQQLADDESLRQDEKAEEAARHSATLESLDALRQAEASL